MYYNNQIFDTAKKIFDSSLELEDKLNNSQDKNQIIELNKSIAKNKHIVAEFLIYKSNIDDLIKCQEALKTEKNADLNKLLLEEVAFLKKNIISNEQKIIKLLSPKDPNDNKNVIIDMKSAAGGNESSIFVSNLFDAYKKYAENNSWELKILDLQENNYGISSITFSISGNYVYSKMKFESGVHRVQRIPSTESKGRVHTSTITVSCMPEKDDIEINIDPSELRIDVFRASGAGGQHVNKTESAIRITHLPTGIAVACQQERSQILNRELAMKILKFKLWEIKNQEQEADISKKIKQQIGRGMRSEKIRTYNYPQNRITDHRILLTTNNLDIVMTGDFGYLHEELKNFAISQNLLNINVEKNI